MENLAMTNSAATDLWAKLPAAWREALRGRIPEERFSCLAERVIGSYAHKTASPTEDKLFKAFEYVEPVGVRVVILGHDPYPDTSKAQGLSFAVPETSPLTPSLKSVKGELAHEYPGSEGEFDRTLRTWASQGVLLLNSLLTVEANGASDSHKSFGWRCFTDAVLKCLDDNGDTVFLLWGEKAKAHKRMLANAVKNELILTAAHPGYQHGSLFRGCGCFSKTNDILCRLRHRSIDWVK